MHPSALNLGKLFFETYCGELQGAVVHDIGAQNVNGSLHDVCPPQLGYVGIDFVEGRGVDIVLDDPYRLPFDDNSLDIIVSSSCFEHSQFFWVIFLEMLRVLKPGGLLYINVPSNGSFHQYPVDCWRFYPDAGKALEAWAEREGYQSKLLESFVGERSPDSFESGGAWNDFVAIFVKDRAFESQFPARMLDRLDNCWNGVDSRSDERRHPGFLSPDHEKLAADEVSMVKLRGEISKQQASIATYQSAKSDLEAQIAALNVELEQRAAALAEADVQYAQKNAELTAAQARIDELLQSRSWQMTAPVRGLASMARRVKARANAIKRDDPVAAETRGQPSVTPPVGNLDDEVDAIRRSAQFDETFYRTTYPDVPATVDAVQHYCDVGWSQGRDPSQDFSTRYYLETYDDIQAAGMNPFFHYVTAGADEGRQALPEALRRRPAHIVDAEVQAIRQSGQFDESYYLAMNPDLQPPPADPVRHYCEAGWMEGRKPSDDFDTNSYLRAYRDIREAGTNPFWHYVLYGSKELRHADPDAAIRYEDDVWFGRINADVRLLAFYTDAPDWVVARAKKSSIKGSSQPLLPHDDLGFYEANDQAIVEHQVQLARRHGLEGFCFSLVPDVHGVLSSQALETCLRHPGIDFKFCARLDLRGAIPASRQLTGLATAFADVRYIRVEGRPLLLIDVPAAAQNTGALVGQWMAELGAQMGSKPFVVGGWGGAAAGEHLPVDLLAVCDALVDLPDPRVPGETGDYVVLDEEGIDTVPYSVVAAHGAERASLDCGLSVPVYHCVVSGRDNTSKRPTKPLVYKRPNVKHYRRWLDAALQAARETYPAERRFLFIEGWNDWNEGSVIEPDRQAGYSRLNETSRSLLGISSGVAMPKVSVIVPNYNHERFLRRRLASVYGQSYKNIEVILLDDCSSDNSRAVLDEYAAAYPEITRTMYGEVNSGGAFRQWAKGIKAATGDLVWIAESDDYCDENFLEVLVKRFEDEAVLLAYAKCAFVHADETPMDNNFQVYVQDLACAAKWNDSYVETSHNEVRSALGIKNTIPNASGVLFRRPVNMRLLDEPWWLSMVVAGDWVFYLHVIHGGKVAFDVGTTNYFRRYEGSTAEATYRKKTFYEEVGLACRTVAALYDVPLSILERGRDGYQSVYQEMVGTSDSEFALWYDFAAVLAARANRLPNVMICTMGFFPGGAEILPIRLANEFKRQGVPVLLLSTGLNPREDGVRRMLANDVPLVETSDVASIKKIISDFGIEVLNTHQWHIQKYPLQVPDVFDGLKGHVATLHGMIEHGNAFSVSEHELRVADSAVNFWVYTADKNLTPFQQLGIYDATSPRFLKMPNGIPTPRIKPVPRAHMGISEDAFVLCCVSRAIPDKGWAETIEAVRLARQLSSRDIHLVLVGNGPVYDDLRRTAMPSHVHLIGFSENAVGYYAAADMGIMLTRFRSESFPLTIIDCLFAGRPFIATEVGEIKNMLTVDERVAGALLKLEDWVVPVDAVARAIASFAEEYERWSDACSVVPDVVGRFTIEEVAYRYINLFCQCALDGAVGLADEYIAQ